MLLVNTQPNFKGWMARSYLLVADCLGHIWPGHICPCNIRPSFIIMADSNRILTKLWSEVILDPKFIGPNIFGHKILFWLLWTKYFLDHKYFGPFIWGGTKLCLNMKYFGTRRSQISGYPGSKLCYLFLTTKFSKFQMNIHQTWLNLALQSNCLSLDWTPAQPSL